MEEVDGLLSSIYDVRRIVIDRRSDSLLKKILTYAFFYFRAISVLTVAKVDVVYLHYPSHTFLPVMLSRLCKRYNIVTNFHGGEAVNQPGRSELFFKIKKKLNKLAIKYSDLVVVPSEYFKDLICCTYDVSPAKVLVNFSGGVCCHKFHPDKNVPISAKRYKLLYVSRMEPVKDPLMVSRFFKKNPEFLEKYNCTFVGSGSLRSKFECELPKGPKPLYKIYDSLAKEKLACEYRKNGFLIQSSLGESLGLVVLEAMASGCIPVCRRIAAFESIISHRVDGFLYDTEDDLKECLLYIERMTAVDIAKMAERSRDKVASGFAKVVSSRLTIEGLRKIENR
ncbi:glycosyltransferase family 4 protein [Halomonas denitrificans]|uniref:glycosyltransferase family 4 protein n=1 Tax=Halomonas denitrificans TaxID=370769 RepID=UPI001CD25E8C|nr:glycosyltransferase family 4 protein [Halomonas denitrificans]MCA0976700.1 glycosyltransferase family 4 protein [Halomonas denitrificans]